MITLMRINGADWNNPDQQGGVSNIVQNCPGLSPNPGVFSSLRARILVRKGNRYSQTQPHPPGVDGGLANSEVFAQERAFQLHRWLADRAKRYEGDGEHQHYQGSTCTLAHWGSPGHHRYFTACTIR